MSNRSRSIFSALAYVVLAAIIPVAGGYAALASVTVV